MRWCKKKKNPGYLFNSLFSSYENYGKKNDCKTVWIAKCVDDHHGEICTAASNSCGSYMSNDLGVINSY